MGENKEVDLYRDTPVRYLGYANEVGESFRSIVPVSFVWASYGVSSTYVLADTLDKARKVYQIYPKEGRMTNVVKASFDTLLWQAFASVIVPGFTINRICALVQYIQRTQGAQGAMRSPWVSTFIGLASIPFIIKPIDHAIDHTMDITYRKWTCYKPPK